MRRHLGLRPRIRAFGVCLASMAVLGLAAPAKAPAVQSIPDDVQLGRMRAMKQMQIRLNMEGARREHAEKIERAWEALEAQKKGLPVPAHLDRAKEAVDDEDLPGRVEPLPRGAKPAALQATNAIPSNVAANDRTTDILASSGQSETTIAVHDNNILVAWNDGDGFGGGSQAPHVQGYGYSTNGGATFTDGVTFPVPAAFPNLTWDSDPVVTVNEKTGQFYYCGLVSPTSTTNGIGVVRGTFSGGSIVWDTPVVALSVSSFTNFTDKQWIVADSSTGNVYISYTDFNTVNDAIRFIRSTDGGVTWSNPIQVNLSASNGLVQGSRPAVGPGGELYVVWKELNSSGSSFGDYMKIRKSTNGGTSFGTTMIAANYFDNFGTGAPGFNRERSVSFPSIAVDRTTGPNRGRVYIGYHESFNFFNDPLGTGTTVLESESNNTSGTADLFSVGDLLRGNLGPSDQDWFKFNATQGTNYIFYCDSIPNAFFSFRVFCSNGSQLLALGGDLSGSPGNGGLLVWTAPTTATYFLRLFYSPGGGASGYRVWTGVGNVSTEPGRDQRDAMVSYSDTGLSWFGPFRMNDDAARYDNFLPEVMVAADGCPYATWIDFRDDATTCAGKSHMYITRSSDGGQTWAANQRVTNVTSDWTASFTNIAPNQGDYNHMAAGTARLVWTWSDARNGDADAFASGLQVTHTVSCQADTAADPSDAFTAHFSVANLNAVFGNDYTYTLSNQRGWTLPAGNLSVAAGASGDIEPLIAVPDTAAAGDNLICMTVTNAKGTISRQCCFTLTVNPTVGVVTSSVAFGLRSISPNPSSGPARVSFGIPRQGRVSLVVFGLQGERVRTLADGEFAAGVHTVAWDGRDARGNAMRPGAYFVRLEGFGQSAVRRFVKVQ
jgi:FlgD Ig-like domain